MCLALIGIWIINEGRKEGKHVGLLEKHPGRQGESQQRTHVMSSVGMEPSPR